MPDEKQDTDEQPESEDEPEREERFETEREWLAYLRGHAAGRDAARREAHNVATLITPQMIKMRNDEGRAWLEDPAQIAVKLAGDIAAFYFHLACVVADPKQGGPHQEWAKKLVFQAARLRDTDIGESTAARLAVFMERFLDAVHRYRSTREVWSREIPDHQLSSDPAWAEAFRQERNRRRDTELIPQLAPDLARQVRDDFSRLYPDEREHIDEVHLARAVEAFALDTKGKSGRKRKGEASKYSLLKRAFSGQSFVKGDTDLETALRRANDRREARKKRANLGGQGPGEAP